LNLNSAEMIRGGVNVFVAATVMFCLARAVPVFWEGWRDILALARPAGRTATVVKPMAARTRRVAVVR
jgi:hypothetical protein